MLAAFAEAAQTRTEWVASILDARRGEFYLGIFHREAQESAEYTPAGEGWLLKPAELETLLASRLPDGTATCVAREHDQAALRLREVLPQSYPWQIVPGTLVEAVARLGLRACRSGKLQAAGDLDALYIRRPDAELNWKP